MLFSVKISTYTKEVKEYKYVYNTTELSTKEAKDVAVRNALVEIVNKESGIFVSGITLMNKMEKDDIYHDEIIKYISTSSSGFVTNHEIINCDQYLENENIVSELLIDVVIKVPDEPNYFDLYAELDEHIFNENDITYISGNIEKPAYLYYFIINEKEKVFVLHVPADKTTHKRKLNFHHKIVN